MGWIEFDCLKSVGSVYFEKNFRVIPSNSLKNWLNSLYRIGGLECYGIECNPRVYYT